MPTPDMVIFHWPTGLEFVSNGKTLKTVRFPQAGRWFHIIKTVPECDRADIIAQAYNSDVPEQVPTPYSAFDRSDQNG